jgi:hypothetical protein
LPFFDKKNQFQNTSDTKKMSGVLAKIPVPVYPLLAVMGGAIGGLAFFGYHKIQHPDLVWARK